MRSIWATYAATYVPTTGLAMALVGPLAGAFPIAIGFVVALLSAACLACICWLVAEDEWA